MERRLLRFIMNPAMFLVLGTGIWLIIFTNALDPQNGKWMHYKLLLVVIMIIAHGFMARCRGLFALDKNTYSTKFYRILNELPTILMIGIVILVVVRPF